MSLESISVRLDKQGDNPSHSFLDLSPINNFTFPVGRNRGTSFTSAEGFFNHKGVSRHHGSLNYKDGKLFFTDNGSRNGTSVIVGGKSYALATNEPFELGPVSAPEESAASEDAGESPPDYSEVCVLHFAPNLSEASALKVNVSVLAKGVTATESNGKSSKTESSVNDNTQPLDNSSPSSFNPSEASSMPQRSSSVSVFDEKDDEIYDQTFVESSLVKVTSPDEDLESLQKIIEASEKEEAEVESHVEAFITTEITETIGQNGEVEETKEGMNLVIIEEADDLDNENYQASTQKDEEYVVFIDDASAAEEIDVENEDAVAETKEDDNEEEEEEEEEKPAPVKRPGLFSFVKSLAFGKKRKRDAEDDGEDLRQEKEEVVEPEAEEEEEKEDDEEIVSESKAEVDEEEENENDDEDDDDEDEDEDDKEEEEVDSSDVEISRVVENGVEADDQQLHDDSEQSIAVPNPANPSKRARVANYALAFGSGAVVGAVGIFSWLVSTAPES